MRIRVTLIIAGKIIEETVDAADYDKAKKTVLARNPTGSIVSVTAIF